MKRGEKNKNKNSTHKKHKKKVCFGVLSSSITSILIAVHYYRLSCDLRSVITPLLSIISDLATKKKKINHTTTKKKNYKQITKQKIYKNGSCVL